MTRQLDLFAAGTLVSLSVLRGSKEARKMTATSGHQCLIASKSTNQIGLLEKMLLGTSTWVSTKCYLTWKAKVTKQGRLLFQLAPSTPRTAETEFGLWATPNTMDHLPPRSEEALLRQATTTRKGRSKPANLREQVDENTMKMWPTPAARDYKGQNSV